jgi:hypothetical protein
LLPLPLPLPLPLLLLLVVDVDVDPDEDGDKDDSENDERHMSADVCTALMALATAVMHVLLGLGQRRVFISTTLLERVPVFLLIEMPLSTGIASESDGGVVAAMASVPNAPTSQDSQASISDREPSEGGSESARRPDSSDAVVPSRNPDSSLPLGDAPKVADGSMLKSARPWLLLPRVWASSGYQLHSIVG